ncbi:MAG: hypothetical protein R3335_01820 [Anaerolineales bacterium]|nr:hypothetical protein [Anaerolineales bacterium]
MDKIEAKFILSLELNQFRSMSYEELKALMGSPRVIERAAPSGISYQIEVESFWDNPRKPEEELRVIGSIDDGRLFHALIPLSATFVMNREGAIVHG